MPDYNSQLQSNNTELQEIFQILQTKAAGGGVELPELTNEGTASDLLLGKELIDGDGNKVTGTFSIDSELNEQDSLIEQIIAAADSLPEADGSSSIDYDVCTVELNIGQCTIDTLSYIALIEGIPTILYFNNENCPHRFENVLCNSPFIISFTSGLLGSP